MERPLDKLTKSRADKEEPILQKLLKDNEDPSEANPRMDKF
jgi:hypothetical protein